MPIYITNQLIINTSQRTLTIDGKNIELSPLSFDLLGLLISNSPNLLTLDVIADTVWGQAISDETVTQRVSLIRKALKTAQIDNKCIESVRNKGYRWLPKVALVDENDELTSSKAKSIKHLKLFLAALVFLCVLLCFFFAINLYKKDEVQQETTLVTNQYVKQANFYLNKFDNSSNDIALKLYQKALAQDADSLKALLGASKAYSHKVTKYNGATELLVHAIEYAKRATVIAPKNSTSWSSLGLAYDAMGDINRAVFCYEKSLSLLPDSPATTGSLAYLLMIKGELSKALNLNIKAFEGNQHYRYLQIAQTLALLDIPEAENWYVHSMNLSPDNVFSASTYAKFLFAHDRNIEAKSIIQSAINSKIKQPELYITSAMISINEKDYAKATKDLEFAKKLKTSFEVNVWLLVLSWLEGSTNEQLLQQLLQSIDQHNPDISWPNTYINFSLVQLISGQHEKAMQNLQKAVKLGYRNHYLLRNIGTILKMERTPEFQGVLQEIEQRVTKERVLVKEQGSLKNAVLQDTL